MSHPSASCLGEVVRLDPAGPDRFRSRFNVANLDGGVFGGQYLGQTLWAAMATAPGYVPQSMCGTFLRAADEDVPLEFEVVRVRDGRRFAQRQVLVRQAGKDLFRADVSLFRPDFRHPAHQRPMPSVPDPRSLKSLKALALERQDFLGEKAVARLLKERFFDSFPVEPDVGMGRCAERPGGLYWARAKVTDGLAVADHYAALAFLSDNMANMASRAMHVANAYDNSLGALSLNHGIWFHHPARVDGWLLFEVESQFAGGGLGSNRGLIYGEDGQLLASFVQDALIEYT